MVWTCSTCGQTHLGLAFAYSQAAPAPYVEIPPEERPTRTLLAEEQCEIDGEHFFVRARIVLPVVGDPQAWFEWGVWASLSKQNYQRMGELWNTSGREYEPDYFCWVSSDLPTYSPSTYLLKGRLQTRPVGERPVVELEPTEHPLAREQRNGITIEHVHAIAEYALHYSVE